MENFEITLYSEFEHLKKILKRDKETLLQIPLFRLINVVKSASISGLLKDIILEFIIKLSEAIYWKSCLILNTHFFEDLKEEDTEVSETTSKEFLYFKTLSLDKVLFDKVFTPVFNSSNIVSEQKSFSNEGNINDLIKVIIFILEREEIKNDYLKNFSEKSINDYMEDIRKYLTIKKSFTFREFLKEKVQFLNREEVLIKIVYYFLALLFLSFYNYCTLVQNNEKEDLIIFINKE